MATKKQLANIPKKHLERQTGLSRHTTPEEFHTFRVDRERFTIYVGGEPHQEKAVNDLDLGEPGVEYRMADRFEMNLDMLSGINRSRPILVKQSSCGGNWEEGMQMFGAILACPNPITVLSTKWARSMTSIIPLAADKFAIRLPAQYMYHRGTFGFSGLDQEAETVDRERKKANELMFRIYTARLGEQGKFNSWPDKKIRTMLERKVRERIDVWLSAQEAMDWGFVDEVYNGNPRTLRAKVRNEERRALMLEVLKKPMPKAF